MIAECCMQMPTAMSTPQTVNPPGTYYNPTNGEPGAVWCGPNTYGPGLKKQSACVPCPGGYKTDKADDNGVITAQSGQALKSACGES